jgi:hypothetical protein
VGGGSPWWGVHAHGTNFNTTRPHTQWGNPPEGSTPDGGFQARYRFSSPHHFYSKLNQTCLMVELVGENQPNRSQQSVFEVQDPRFQLTAGGTYIYNGLEGQGMGGRRAECGGSVEVTSPHTWPRWPRERWAKLRAKLPQPRDLARGKTCSTTQLESSQPHTLMCRRGRSRDRREYSEGRKWRHQRTRTGRQEAPPMLPPKFHDTFPSRPQHPHKPPAAN